MEVLCRVAFYTVQIRSLYESGFDFGLKNYPIWDESKRDWLNQSIINHYYEYEIGYETPGIFKFKLNVNFFHVRYSRFGNMLSSPV